MAVLELAKPAEPINNNLVVVQLPHTQVRTSKSQNTLEQGYPLANPITGTANIITTFDNRLTNRFFSQLFIDGGSA